MKKITTTCTTLLLSTLLAACGDNGADNAGVTQTMQATRSAAAIVAAPDEVSVAAYRANVTIAVGPDGSISLTDKLAGATQVLQGRPTISFFDRHTSFDLDGVPGQVYRLYQAAFGRTPDAGGLGFWIQAVRSGVPMETVAGVFIDSEEFRRTYGENVANGPFLALVYRNVLRREAEPDGYAWWLRQLDNGVARAAVLASFSESEENRTRLHAAMAAGFDFEPYAPGAPLVPKPSSYENREAALAALGPQPISQAGNLPGWNTVAYAFADFFQDGSYAMVSHTQESDNGVNYPAGPPSGHIKFWKRDANGAWTERTSDLLQDDGGCILSRKAVVADFNNDGLPDVYFACSGFDKDPFDGEYQRVLLSDRGTGRYRNTQVAVKGYVHGGSAADVDGDGRVDIVVADMRGNGSRNPVYVLKGDGKGGFQPDYAAFDRPELNWQANGPFFNIELIDFEGRGRYDAIIGGIETDSHRTLIIPHDGAPGNYTASSIKRLPSDSYHTTPEDFAYDRATRTIYVNRINDWGSRWPDGVANAIQKVDYDSMQGTTIFTHQGFYNRQETLVWIEWIGLYKNRIVSLNAGYGVDIPK